MICYFMQEDWNYMKCTYHDQVSPQYQWLQNDYKMEDKTCAILYTSNCGEYKCRVTVDEGIHDGGAFSVTGMLNNIGSCW